MKAGPAALFGVRPTAKSYHWGRTPVMETKELTYVELLSVKNGHIAQLQQRRDFLHSAIGSLALPSRASIVRGPRRICSHYTDTGPSSVAFSVYLARSAAALFYSALLFFVLGRASRSCPSYSTTSYWTFALKCTA